MERRGYRQQMEQRIRDLSLQIESVGTRLSDGGLIGALSDELAALEQRRDLVREKLEALEDEPDGTWDDLRAEIEGEWDALVQHFEERLADLA